MKPYIDLRQMRDVGDLISTYIAFLKKNFSSFFSIFLHYNGIFIIAALLISYLVISGYWGVWGGTEETGILGLVLLIMLYFITSVFNYSLAAAYLREYVKNKEAPTDKKQVFRLLRNNMGSIIIFILLMGLIYVVIMIAGLIISIVPVLGSLAYYVIFLAFSAWAGLSFMALFQHQIRIEESFKHGWTLLKDFFWKSVLANLVISMLLGFLMISVLMIPGVFLGAYSYFFIDSFSESIVSQIIWILALTLLLIIFMLYQSFSQFINGILYYSLYEEKYHEAAQERIELIGKRE